MHCWLSYILAIHVQLSSVHLIGDVFKILQKKFLFSSPMENGVAFFKRDWIRENLLKALPLERVSPIPFKGYIEPLYKKMMCYLILWSDGFLKCALVFFEKKQIGPNRWRSPIWNPSHYDIWSHTWSFYKLICNSLSQKQGQYGVETLKNWIWKCDWNITQ